MNKMVPFIAALILLVSCDPPQTDIRAFYTLPTDLYGIPSDPMNTITQVKVDAGRVLFSEPALSLSGTVSCASCHDVNDRFQSPDMRFIGGCGEGCFLGAEGYELSPGYHASVDSMIWVNSRGATNIAYATNAGLSARFGGTTDSTWRAARIAHFGLQDRDPAFQDRLFSCEPSLFQAQVAISGHRQFSPARLWDRPDLIHLLEQTFDKEITKATPSDSIEFMIACAIDAFQRTQLTTDSPFQRYLRGEQQLDSTTLKGFELVQTHCTGCHSDQVFGGTIAPSAFPNWPGFPDAVNDIYEVEDTTLTYRTVKPMLGGMKAYGPHAEQSDLMNYLQHHLRFNDSIGRHEGLSKQEVQDIHAFIEAL